LQSNTCVLLHCSPNSAAGRSAQFYGKGIYQVYTWYRMAFHMTGIYQVYDRYMTYGIYLVYTCHMTMLSYDRYIPGIFQVYTSGRRMSGIYQVYTIIINFLGIPDGCGGPALSRERPALPRRRRSRAGGLGVGRPGPASESPGGRRASRRAMTRTAGPPPPRARARRRTAAPWSRPTELGRGRAGRPCARRRPRPARVGGPPASGRRSSSGATAAAHEPGRRWRGRAGPRAQFSESARPSRYWPYCSRD
jgi:hypothetical protein